MKRRSVYLGLALCVVVAVAGVVWGVRRSGAAIPRAELEWVDNPGSWDDSAASIPVSSADPTWGARDAPVTLVLFSDFQCPFCGKIEPSINAAQKRYGPHKLRLVWKHFPLAMHKNAMPAHLASETVFQLGGSRAFFQFHDLAFDHQRELDFDGYGAWAKASGVDMTAFYKDYQAKKYGKKVLDDVKLGNAIGVRSTPSLFVNGILLKGAGDPDLLAATIEKELEATEALVKSGTPADQVYVARTNANRPPGDPDDDDKKKSKTKVKPEDVVHKVALGSSPVRGPADALVTIVLFGDLDCPYTRELEPAIAAVLAQHPGDVRVAWKSRPLPVNDASREAALVAAQAQAEQGNEGFWKAHDALLAKEDLTPAGAREIAAKLGLDVEKTKALLTDAQPSTPELDPSPDATLARVVAADEDVADELGVTGTPQLFVNGRTLVGRVSKEELEALVTTELAKAEAQVKGGTARAGVYDALQAAAADPPPAEKLTIDPAPADAPTRGPKDARLEVHVFGDFECPFSKRAETTLRQVERRWGDKLRFVWRDRPLEMHKNAVLAAQAAREARAQKGEAGFWGYHDALFAAQGSGELDAARLSTIGAEQGLDVKALEAALADKRWEAAVKASADQAQSWGITGTPTFVFVIGKKEQKLEGYSLSGALPFSKFKKTIRLALRATES